MRVLVTSSRMPFALAIIRRLAEEGHEVLAADAYDLAPGSHSRYVEGHFVTASPRADTEAFVDDVERIVAGESIDVVVPSFEEVFYLSSQHARLSAATRLFAAPFATLLKLHDKASFEELATGLGLRMPETVVASTADELKAALERFPRYFARAAFSRGGVTLLTNTGPLAGRVAAESCEPSARNPWLVQEFVEGETMCTYSTAHEGRVTSHCTYRIPLQWRHSTGIQFLSAEGDASLALVEPIVRELGYTGQISFDFIDSPDGPVLIECNPRATDGVLLTPAGQLAAGLLEPGGELARVPAGESVQLDMAVFAEMFSGGMHEAPRTLSDLFSIPGSDRGWHDLLPDFYSFLALVHHERLKLHEHEALFEAMASDISWDGEPIAGMSDEDARLLASLRE